MKDKIKDLIAGGVIGLVALFGAVFHVPVPFFFAFVALFGILFHAQLLGTALFPRTTLAGSIAAGSLVVLAIQTVIQVAFFYLGWKLDAGSDAWSLVFTIVTCQILHLLLPVSGIEPPRFVMPRQDRLFKALFFIGLAGALSASVLVQAWQAATTDSIRTPWPLLPNGILVSIAALWVLVILSEWLSEMPAVTSILTAISTATITLIVPLMYRLGFGFDGFLHVATERLLMQTGSLQPKPLYYMGQYVFTTWFSRFTDLPIETVDRWLVPVSAAIILPFVAYVIRQREIRSSSWILFFLLPCSAFIATTPQSFAYLIGLCAIFLALGREQNRVHWLAPLLVGLWSIAIHPLAGVPFFLVACALCIATSSAEHRRILHSILASVFALGAGIAVPGLFFLFSLKQGSGLHWNFQSLFSIGPWQSLGMALFPSLENHFVLWPAWTSLVVAVLPLLLFCSAILSLRAADFGRRLSIICLILAAGTLIVSSTVLKTAGDFAFLIDYERGNYADRLLTVAVFLLFPAAMPWLAECIERAKQARPSILIGVLVSCAALGSALAYDALPRHDALVTGRSWSVGAADLEAVRFIQRDAHGATYGVLADQSVSAAAVSQFGFARYTADDVFYYPIPTGGPLYELYLRLTYEEPTIDPIKDAAALSQSDVMYVVINDYWWNADALQETLGSLAQDHWVFGDPSAGLGHSVSVFKFDPKAPSKASTQTNGS